MSTKTSSAKIITCASAAIASALFLTGCFMLPGQSSSSNQNSNQNASVAATNNSTPVEATSNLSNSNVSTDNTNVATSTTTTPQVQGKYYQRYAIMDPQTGVNAFSAFLPQGWTANIQSNWNVISIGAPGFAEVTLTSPDGQATITIDSCQAYTQQPSGVEGQSFEYYTTYMNYLNAPAFVDRFMDAAYPGQYQLVQDLGVDDDTLGMLCQYNDQCVAVSNAEGAAITMNGQIGGVNSVAEPKDATMCKRQYSLANGQYMEASCVDAALTQTISSPYLTEQYVHWRIPYSIVYAATDKPAFDRYYDDYTTIVANSCFTDEFYSAVNYVAKQITSAAMDAKAAASGYSASGYVDETAASTNDKVMGMWDDYINEVDSYNTLDGGTVKTSMYNDVVAQDGNNFFVGSSTSDIPYGYTELSKSY